ncbi:hypothetical protein CEXT_370441, partial [Caerostris extrusa]
MTCQNTPKEMKRKKLEGRLLKDNPRDLGRDHYSYRECVIFLRKDKHCLHDGTCSLFVLLNVGFPL